MHEGLVGQPTAATRGGEQKAVGGEDEEEKDSRKKGLTTLRRRVEYILRRRVDAAAPPHKPTKEHVSRRNSRSRRRGRRRRKRGRGGGVSDARYWADDRRVTEMGAPSRPPVDHRFKNFIHQFSATLDPSTTVRLCHASVHLQFTKFIHQCSTSTLQYLDSSKTKRQHAYVPVKCL